MQTVFIDARIRRMLCSSIATSGVEAPVSLELAVVLKIERGRCMC
jgi:hypothetical protein